MINYKVRENLLFPRVHSTFSSISKPEARTLTPSMAKQQVNPCLGNGLFTLAQDSTQSGPTQKCLKLASSSYSDFIVH